MTITLYDLSTPDVGGGLDFVIFRPADKMPEIDTYDVVVAHAVKVRSSPSTPPLPLPEGLVLLTI